MEGNTVRWETGARLNASLVFQPVLNVGHPFQPLLGDGMNKQHGNAGERKVAVSYLSYLSIGFKLLDIIPWV